MSTSLSSLSETEGRDAFRSHLKPRLAKLLAAIGLDVVYSRGQGDHLYYQDAGGQERLVLDMLGGFGASLFGHNHPVLVGRAVELLQSSRPFAAQGSARSYAGLLAKRLSDLVGQSTGQTYMATLANSGAEAVEAAIKHAEFERRQRIQAIISRLKRTFKTLRNRLNQENLRLPEGLLAEVARLLSVPELEDLDELEFHLLQYNQRLLEGESGYLAIKGAFHGKTTGALKLTHNPEFRTPWHGVGIQAQFIPADDEAALAQAIGEARTAYYELVLSEAGEISLETRPWSRLVACLVEPIQGEGGIHELAPSYLQALRAAADREGYPLIIDEIQSGMGRTGTFLASAIAGVRGDYYLFSKSLGGGLAKIAALLVQADRYIEDFGYLHTSTFADDDFSCAIALAALDLVERDEGALMQACHKKGEYLLQKLRNVQDRYPEVIKEVRGRGLMLGIELKPQHDSASPLLRVASEQNLLNFLLCGYLLNEEGIRVTPTLSANNTIRLEPSAYIAYDELDQFCHSLERAVAFIAGAETHRLLRFMSGHSAGGWPVASEYRAALPYRPFSEGPVARKVACIAHFINPEDLLHWDPTLGPLTGPECSQLLERAEEIMEPFIAAEEIITSPLGERISLTVIGLPLYSARMMNHMRNGQVEAVTVHIEKGVELAKRLGCTLVGFAGYTSIATNNCLTLVEDKIGLTSGNSLTAAAAIEATHQAARQMGITLESARLGVVGGVGNIGRVLAEIEAELVESVLLVGRPGAQRRLVKLAESLYAQAWQRLKQGEIQRGLARTLAQSEIVGRLQDLPDAETAGAVLYQAFAESGQAAPVQLTTDLADLQDCNLIICATNSPEPIIGPEHLSTEPVVICDVSVPTDIQPTVYAQRPWVRVVKGGIVQLPQGQALSIGGMDLPEGQFYACLSEVILLGLAGIQTHFSYGPLRPERVRQLLHLAEQHQFKVVINEQTAEAYSSNSVALIN